MSSIYGLMVAAGLAILVLAGCKELPPNESSASTAAVDAGKSVLALQAFIDRDSHERIMATCSDIKDVEGYYSELETVFIPHITLGSWIVTPQELKLAESQFGKRLAGLSCAAVSMTLVEEEREDGRLAYYLRPEPTPSLLEFHAQAHSKLGWVYAPFRQFDLPGKWEPHLTLFSIPRDQRHSVSAAILKLRKIRNVRIERIGLLGLRPTSIALEMELDKADSIDNIQ